MPRLYRYAPLVTFLLVTLINFLPLGERRFEDDAEVLVSPAGWAFSIWGVIFTGLIGFSILIARGLEPDTPALRKAIIGLCIAGFASIAFVPISISGDAALGFIDILAHLIPLIYAYGQLREHIKTTPPISIGQRFWFYGPSMYLGWISAATVISTALFLDQVGFKPEGDMAIYGATALVVILFFIGKQFQQEADNIYGFTVAWALFGLGFEQAAYPTLANVAWIAAAILLVSGIVRLVRGKFGFYASPGYYR